MAEFEYAFVSLPTEFGSAVRIARKNRGMSQTELAQASGCSQRFVSQLERGKQTAELGKALQVAKAAGLRMFLEDADAVDETRELVNRE